MFNFLKKKAPKIKGVYVLTFTAETMDDDALNPVLNIAATMLHEKHTSFANLWDAANEETLMKSGNYLYNADMHNPQTMQVAMDTWLIGQHDVKFEPEFGENFFPHAMRDPQGRENYFLYYFDVEETSGKKKGSLIDMFE
jgi:hypothetical protein